MKNDDEIKKASIHFSLTDEGELSRDSFPFESRMRNNCPIGVGFNKVDKSRGYSWFHYTPEKGAKRIKIYSHRLVFLLHNGYLPRQVDHIDRDRSNNHPRNLREATSSQNQMNKTPLIGSSSKYLGVSWSNREKKWIAAIKINGKSKTIGAFKCEDEAAEAYNDYALLRDPEFNNLNITK